MRIIALESLIYICLTRKYQVRALWLGVEDLLRRNHAHVDTPNHAGQRTNQVPALDRLDGRKVDQTNSRPEFPSSHENGPELVERGSPDGVPVDAGEVDCARAGPEGNGLKEAGDAGRRVKSGAQGVDIVAEEEGIEGGADGLVEDQLDGGVADGQLWRRRRVVGFLWVRGGRIGGECGF